MELESTPYVFGSFRLEPARRALLMSGQAVPISARAFDILLVLIEARDRVVGREELLARVWPGMTVEASNLTVQMSTLRRALGDTGDDPKLIATVTGRGYRFIGQLGTEEVATVPTQRPRKRWMVPAAAALLLATVAGAWQMLRPGDAGGTRPRLSIVVMPFRDLSDDRSRGYLADAISDDLTTDLSHIPGSLVIARASADVYKGNSVPADQIGRALNVRYLLEGSLRGSLDKLRINAQLIDTQAGTHLWAARFDVGTARLFDAQTDIVRRIASALDAALVDVEAARAARERPENPDALDLFFRARSVLDHGNSLADLTSAQDLLERAIARSPDFVDALALLGRLLVRKEQAFEYPTAAADDVEAARVIRRALQLAPRDPEALAARGRLLVSDGRIAEASAAFEAALAVDPTNVSALYGQAQCAWRLGQPERVGPPLQAMQRIDPLGPSVGRDQLAGLAALFAGHARAALPYLLRSEAADGGPPADVSGPTQPEITRLYLIAATGLAGDAAEARRRYQAFAAIWPHRTIWREAALFTPAQTGVPAFPAIESALAAAGMRRFADPDADDGVAPSTLPLAGGEFTATPLMVPGAVTIDTAELRRKLAGPAPPAVLDVGKGMAVPAGAVLLAEGDPPTAGGVVVMDTGAAGVDGYNAALRLAGRGIGEVYWYRGGEEAWAAAGQPAQDRRGP